MTVFLAVVLSVAASALVSAAFCRRWIKRHAETLFTQAIAAARGRHREADCRKCMELTGLAEDELRRIEDLDDRHP